MLLQLVIRLVSKGAPVSPDVPRPAHINETESMNPVSTNAMEDKQCYPSSAVHSVSVFSSVLPDFVMKQLPTPIISSPLVLPCSSPSSLSAAASAVLLPTSVVWPVEDWRRTQEVTHTVAGIV